MHSREDPSDPGVTYYDIWTHRGSVKYTFKGSNEDLWQYETIHGMLKHVHDADGYGLPYYALIESIEGKRANP